MIRYLLRLAPLVARAQAAQPTTIGRLDRRVRLSQIDLNRHMNQAAYAAVAEEGRTDLVLRSGFWKRVQGRGINPVVASQEITYRRELKPLQRFQLDSRIVGVDGRLLRIECHFLVGDRVHARAEARLIFVGPDGVVGGDVVEDLVVGMLAEPLVVQDWRVVDC